jgi:choline dehydrogenase-like flavoprotein
VRTGKRDVVILGSGGGGGPLALTLAQAGLDVLVLEKGPRYRREDYLHDEVAHLHRSFFAPSAQEEPHTVMTRKTTTPVVMDLGWIANCVGGGTVHMGAFLYRFHPDDFRMARRFGPSEELADWPYGYEELEPYYCRAEREVGVSGLAGANPFEGPRSQPFPMPPLGSHPLAPRLEEACRRRGWHPFPTPRSINSVPYKGRPACIYCDFCASFGCPVGARGSSQEALIARAEATGRCELRTRAMAREITVGRDGRATGCVYLDAEGNEHEVEAEVVCVCCSAVESARLLLLSKSSRFPDGLANGNGRVGRHLQFHGVTMGEGRFLRDRHPELSLDDPHPFIGRSLMDHYFLPDGVSDLAKGGLIRFDMSLPTPVAAAQALALGDERPVWGLELKRRLRRYFRDQRAIHFEVFHDFLPNAGTWMELDPEVRDKWGLPVARIHLDLPLHHRLAGEWVADRAFEILDDLGAEELSLADLGGTSRYLVHGTCRAGHDPETSVLDAFCRTHEVPNLYVVDGSFMPTSGGAPPTLTILANSFRVAEHIAKRFRGEPAG